MFKLNYFNKIVGTILLILSVGFSHSIYLYLFLTVAVFIYGVFHNDYRTFIASLITTFFLTLSLRFGWIDIWIFKISLIFTVCLILNNQLTPLEKNVFLENLFYKKNHHWMIKNRYYKKRHQENKMFSLPHKYKKMLKKECRKKSIEDVKNITILSELKYYGFQKKRTHYAIRKCSWKDILFFMGCCLLFFFSIVLGR